jgi:triosephosphate isomerase
MRKPFVAGNWKMNLNGVGAEALAAALVQKIGQEARVDMVVCPPYPYLTRVAGVLQGSNIKLGAQNVHPEQKGAFTGEVSPPMLSDCGCSWVLTGHSERRHLLGEMDDFIHRKIVGGLAAGLSVVFCVGETLLQRQERQTDSVVETQLSQGLERLSAEQLKRVVVAYEPVWAIGTGLTASPEQAQHVHEFIRGWLDGYFGPEPAVATRILYGGSVDPSKVTGLMRQPDIDGLLVGGASLKADDFTAIVLTASLT